LVKTIGIDIGGTKTAIGLFEDGALRKKQEIKTDSKLGGEHILNRIIEVIMPYVDDDLKGIGIGAAGQISRAGEVMSSTDTFTNWKGLNVKQIISRATSSRVEVVNDVQAMGLGELHFGAGKNVRDFICIALGTGVGGAIIADGKLIRGHRGAGGEFGHVKLYADGRSCPCGNKGCLEAHISGIALETRYKEMFGINDKGPLIFQKARNGDEKAQDIVNQYLDDLIEGLTSLIHIFNPEKVVIGGGVATSLIPYISGINDTIHKKVSDVNAGVLVELSPLGGNAMLLGAASLVM
jgi:glucokinase